MAMVLREQLEILDIEKLLIESGTKPDEIKIVIDKLFKVEKESGKDCLFDFEFEIETYFPKQEGTYYQEHINEEFEFDAWFSLQRGKSIIHDQICEMPEELKKIYHEKFIEILKENE